MTAQGYRYLRRQGSGEGRPSRVKGVCEQCGGGTDVSARVARNGGGRFCRRCALGRAAAARVESDPTFPAAQKHLPLYHLQEPPCAVRATPAWVLPDGRALVLVSHLDMSLAPVATF